jgi:sarcosine oxidase subunit alpha
VDAAGQGLRRFQNDVTDPMSSPGQARGFRPVEHLKRYTTLGMATDQGKTSNVNGLAIMAEQTGRSVQDTGTTRYRFPYTAIPYGALAGTQRGELFRPFRRMPAHAQHEAAGAVFEDYGGWLRPAYYPKAGETPHAAEQRESIAVRQRAGLFEGSPLGKIEVKGPDAVQFLDRIYANTMGNLAVGKARYGLMLNELGVAIDDGVTARLGEDHFLVGTTGAGSGRIAAWLEEWLQCEWPHLKLVIAPVTTAWAVVTLTGPKAREILAAAGTDLPLSPADFPHMTFREGTVAGLKARVFRVSFTGEVSYEINVPAEQGGELWDRLMAAGRPFGIEPVGIDAWMLLRTEKGYLHIGGDTDGTTLPDDIGWSRIMKRSVDFIGRRSLTTPNAVRPDRHQFVGLDVVGSNQALPIGAHLRGESVTSGSEGYVTSAGFSPTLGRGVALAMIRGGRAREGEIVNVMVNDQPVKAKIVQPAAYDPKGELLNG